MVYTISLYGWRQPISHAASFAFDKLIREPLAGIADLVKGLCNVVPPLCGAAKTAVVDAVSARLTPVERQAVEQGTDKIKSGLEMLAWPLSIVAGIVLWRFPVLVWLFLLFAAFGLPV